MVEKMPDECKGKTKKSCGYTKSLPREWTPDEINWIKSLSADGYSATEIAESVDRTKTSVAIKMKRLSKSDGGYNDRHRDEKYELNSRFIEYVNPVDVLDCYSGKNCFYVGEDVLLVSNDIDESANSDYHMDALKLLCKMYQGGYKFDVIDLDPYGSAYDCFDLAVKMARKGLAITFGELGHKRWKRLDFVSRYYGIDDLGDFTIGNLVEHVQMIGRRNKKKLVVWDMREWQNIGRVWFTIEDMKITEQWEKGEVDE